MTTESPGQVRPFAAVLQDLKRGEVLEVAATELQALVKAVITNGKKGSFTLKVDVAPMKGDSRALVVSAQVKTTPPAGQAAEAVFFADHDSNLVREDPDQLALPGLRTVHSAVNPDNVKEIAK